MNRQTVQVLLVEDNQVDREAVRRAFRTHRIANPIIDAVDGMDALDVLRGQNGRERITRPYLILLDINLPRMNGIELLHAIRADGALRDSVVFVLTTSDAEPDRMQAYDANVAGYIVKADVGAQFIRLVDLLQCYWKVVELPEQEVAS